MGTGKEQAELWGPGARDWSDYNEPMCTPFYQAVLDAAGVGAGTALLDAGCGGGFALLLAARRGAVVSGFDVTPALLDIARERVPGASLTTTDLEEPLPYPLTRAFAGSRTPDAAYRQENIFRYLVARV